MKTEFVKITKVKKASKDQEFTSLLRRPNGQRFRPRLMTCVISVLLRMELDHRFSCWYADCLDFKDSMCASTGLNLLQIALKTLLKPKIKPRAEAAKAPFPPRR